MTEFPETASIEHAHHIVATTSTWKSRVYRQSVKKSDSISRINQLYDKTDEANSKLMAEGEPPFFTVKSRNKRGTKAEFENLKAHVRKGCYQDPLPCREMSYPLASNDSDNDDETNSDSKRSNKRPPKLGSRRGTSGLESSNKTTNKSANDQTRLGMELSDARTELRVHQHNNRKDRMLQAVAADPSVIPISKSIYWWLDEENDQHAVDLSNNLASSAAAQRLSKLPPHEFVEEPTGRSFLPHKESIPVERELFLAGVSETVTASVARAARETPNPSFLRATAAVATMTETAASLTVPAAVASPPTAVASPASSSPSYYHSSGATAWGRKEHGHRGRPMTQQTVSLPLNAQQQAIAAAMLSRVTVAAPQSQQQTVNQIATNLMQQWNTEHSLSLLANSPSNQGGMLTQPHARQIVAQATTAAVTQAFGFLPPGMLPVHHVPIQPRQGNVMPTTVTAATTVVKKPPPVLKALCELTEVEVQAFTSREALDYCNKFSLSKPNTKEGRVQAILRYMRDPGQPQHQQKKQGRGKKRASNEP